MSSSISQLLQSCDHDMNRRKPRYSWIICLCISGVILYHYFVYIFCFCWEALFTLPLLAIIGFLVSTFFVGISLYSYWMAATVDPGRVPDEWRLSKQELAKLRQPSQHAGQHAHNLNRNNAMMQSAQTSDASSAADDEVTPLQQQSSSNPSHQSSEIDVEIGNNHNQKEPIELKHNGRIRWCKTCLIRKPDRCHHCRVCGRCHLRFDHHCVWLNNCIAFANYKYFCLFILYLVAQCAWFCFTTAVAFVRVFKDTAATSTSVYVPTFGEVNLVINYFLAFMFGFCLSLFLGFHLFLVLQNMSTIEFVEKQTKFRRQHKEHPYNLGIRQNWNAVFGTNPLLWFWPTRSTVPGDGCFFPRVTAASPRSPAAASRHTRESQLINDPYMLSDDDDDGDEYDMEDDDEEEAVDGDFFADENTARMPLRP